MPVSPLENNPQMQVKVLLVDDDESEFFLVTELLKDRESAFALSWADSLEKGIERLRREKSDVVLLDLFLGDSRGLETFEKLRAEIKDTPIVILSGLDDELSAVEAIQKGAQDFLVKDHVDGNRLARVIQFAIKRNQVQNDPKNVGLVDALTSLYNKAGFEALAEEHVKVARRSKNDFFVCCAVLNDTARIAHVFGASECDRALLTVSDVLKESFRSGDLIARLGHDEFAVIVRDQDGFNRELLSARVKNNQKYYNAQFNRYRLSLSLCAVRFSSENLSVENISAKITQVFADYKGRKNTSDFVPQ